MKSTGIVSDAIEVEKRATVNVIRDLLLTHLGIDEDKFNKLVDIEKKKIATYMIADIKSVLTSKPERLT